MTEPIHIADAKVSAQHFQALLIEGVAPDAAILLTNSYMMHRLAIRMQQEQLQRPVTTPTT